MRIAMTSYYLPSCSKIGVGYWVHAYANELVSRGHDVTVFSPCTRPDGAEYEFRQVQVAGSLRTFRWALALRHVDFTGFDVLHAHGDDYWLWRRRASVHVRTMHGSCFSEAIHIHGVKERLRMIALGLGETIATVVADHTAVISPETRRWMPWVKTVIPDGVDLKKFQPGPKSSHPTILFVGTYHQRKRGHLLLDVFEREVRPAIPNAELLMVCSDAPAAPGVQVLGRVTEERLLELYRSSWVFCLPSTYEGLGIPYIEAIASGTLTVATPNPGSRFVLRDGAGVLASDENLGRRLIETLLRPDPEVVRRGLCRAKELSMESTAAAYESTYAQ